MKSSSGDAPDHPKLPILPPFAYFLPFLAGVALHHIVGADRIPRAWVPPMRLLGCALIAVGAAINISGWLAFHRAGTPVFPHKPTIAIVKDGPYRFTRNPLYLSLAIAYLGVALLLGYFWPLIFFPVAVFLVDRSIIPREEQYLEGKFGAEYTRYRDSVRRWI